MNCIWRWPGEGGARYPCPQCGTLCPAHDFSEKRWRHLNFFRHHCYITASVPPVNCPNHLRWAVLKRGHVDRLTTNQLLAIAEMTKQGLDTMTAWKLKEKLPGIRKARTPRAALWRIIHFLNYARVLVGDTPRLEPVRKALATLKTHKRRVVQRWTSTYTNARLEGFNHINSGCVKRVFGAAKCADSKQHKGGGGKWFF